MRQIAAVLTKTLPEIVIVDKMPPIEAVMIALQSTSVKNMVSRFLKDGTVPKTPTSWNTYQRLAATLLESRHTVKETGKVKRIGSLVSVRGRVKAMTSLCVECGGVLATVRRQGGR